MKRWIVASSDQELSRLRADLNASAYKTESSFTCFRGSIHNEPIWLGVIGVGVVSAALALGELLATEEVDQVIMVGSAGAFEGSGLVIGDVAVASSETLAELGVCKGFGIGDADDLRLYGLQQTVPMDRQLCRSIDQAAQGRFRILTGPFLTVLGVSDSPEQATARASRFQALAENMEGYALAVASRRFEVPAVEIRGISNMAGNREKSAWNLSLANDRAQAAALCLCESVRRV